jgi:hypothetical protein
MVHKYQMSRDISVGVEMDYGLDGEDSIPGPQDFSLLRSVWTGSGAHPTSYAMSTDGSFLGAKVDRE